jgi:hypothetical protein
MTLRISGFTLAILTTVGCWTQAQADALAPPVSTRALDYPMERPAAACQCFPYEAISKQYVDWKPLWPKGYWRKFSCLFACIAPSGEAELVRGTQEDSFRMSDDGRHFICKGYVMKWVETPLNPKRFGFYTIGKVRPFNAIRSSIPELQQWGRASGCQ